MRRAGDTSFDLTVRYYDRTGIDATTLDAEDIRVFGPSGVALDAWPLGPGVETVTTAGTARTVTYRMTPPGGAWDVSDNGTYRIVMQANQVRDTDGNAIPAGEIGRFRVAIPDPAVIDVRRMLAAGEASVNHTPLDIGPVENLFDGDTSTLVRTPAINPAVFTLAFQSPQTVTGFRSYFSHASGNPAFRYTVETADSLADLDDRARSYRELVPLTGAVSDQFSTVNLANAHTATHFRLTATRLYGDHYVHVNEWQLLADHVPDLDAPAATLQSVAPPEGGRTAQFLHVMFRDDTGVDVRSLDTGDLRVHGPDGLQVIPTFYDVDDHTNGSSRIASYWFIPAGGAWTHRDNGVYTVELQLLAVRDTLGNTSVVSEVLGTFTVDIPSPQRQPPSDLAEENAADWVAWAEHAAASVHDDSGRRVAGQSSIRFETNGGGDTSLAYPAPGVAEWDLTTATALRFSAYAENANTFQEGIWVRLNSVDGGYFEYRYYQDNHPAVPLNEAIGKWTDFVVSLDPPGGNTGWRRTVSGTPTFAQIGSVEFHADTWGHGFSLWLDDVAFLTHSWQNPAQKLDVNADGSIVPLDVLIVINALNLRQYFDTSGRLPWVRPADAPYLDVSGDGYCTPYDVLLIINYLNSVPRAEGESGFAAAAFFEPIVVHAVVVQHLPATAQGQVGSRSAPQALPTLTGAPETAWTGEKQRERWTHGRRELAIRLQSRDTADAEWESVLDAIVTGSPGSRCQVQWAETTA